MVLLPWQGDVIIGVVVMCPCKSTVRVRSFVGCVVVIVDRQVITPGTVVFTSRVRRGCVEQQRIIVMCSGLPDKAV